jgi:hypothetical protein
MAPESTQPLTEISTKIFLGVKGGRQARKTDNFTAICEPIVYKMWEPRRLTTVWASWPVTGIDFPFQYQQVFAEDSG